MTNPEAAIAWRLFELNWIPLAAMFVALAISLTITDFSIALTGALSLAGVTAVYVGFAYYNARESCRGNPKVVFMLGGIAQALLIPGLMTPLTYIAASAGFPMQDANLFKLDQALGLDWRAYLSFVDDHRLLSVLLAKSYGAIGVQMLIIPLLLSAVGKFRHLQQYVLALALTLMVTTAISSFVPALGAYHQLGLVAADHPNVIPAAFISSLTEIPALRDGSLRHLNLSELVGVVTFPSFHSSAAVLFAWALWPVRWVRIRRSGPEFRNAGIHAGGRRPLLRRRVRRYRSGTSGDRDGASCGSAIGGASRRSAPADGSDFLRSCGRSPRRS